MAPPPTGTRSTSATWRLSGAGLLIIEATAVEAIGRITPGCLGLWSDATEAALQRVLQAGARAFAHAHRHPAGPCRAQGLEPRALGRRHADCARPARRLAAGGAVGAAAAGRRGAAAGAGRRRAAAHRRRLRRCRAARAPAGPGRDRAACRARLPAAPVPVADRQRAQRRLRRLAGKPHALAAAGVRRGARGRAGGHAGGRAPVGHRLGRRRLGPGAKPGLRARAASARPELSACVQRRRVAAAEDRRRSPSAPATRWGWPRRCGARPGCRPSPSG